MGEIFARRSAATRVDFTGERLTSGQAGQTEFEHLHRYFFAREFCRDKDVLDIAAGEGYGSAYLAQQARTVIGVEIAEAMVAHASDSYPQNNLNFRKGDARRLEFAAKSFDVVTSFETIEHFCEQAEFLDEVSRVLRPNGVFIVSSPDRDIYSPPGSPVNPFHARELSRQEFEAMLRARFVHCDFYAQRPMTGTALLLDSAGAGQGSSRTFERRGDQHFEASSGLPRAPYVVAVASNAAPAERFDSVYIETSDIEGYARNMAALLAQQAEQFGQQIDGLQQELQAAARAAEIAEDRIQSLAAQILSMATQIQSIETSTTWRWTAPIRRAANRLANLRAPEDKLEPAAW
jgi:SAM-dependent methyltransferase